MGQEFNSSIRTSILVIIISILYFTYVVIWSFLIPLHGGPDELTHLFLVEYLYKFGRVPVPHIDPDQPFLGSLTHLYLNNKQFWYYGLPFLNALGGVATAKLTIGLFPTDLTFLSARLFNWLLAPIFFMSLVAIGRAFALRISICIPIALAVALVPQVVFIFSYFNADALGLCSTALLSASLARILNRNKVIDYFFCGLFCGLVLCTKIYYYPALLFVILVYISIVTYKFGVDITNIFVAILACFIVAIPVLLLTYHIFGQVTGLGAQADFTNMHKNLRMCFVFCDHHIINKENLERWIMMFSHSFFGVLGWMRSWLPRYDYIFFFTLSAALFIYSLYTSLFKLYGNPRNYHSYFISIIAFLFFSMTFGVIAANLYGSQMNLPQPQGRYGFVVIPFSVFLLSACLSSYPDCPKARKA